VSDTYAHVHAVAATWPLTWACSARSVSTSGYYAWCGRPPSPRQKKRHQLATALHEIHAQVKQRYGSPRMHAELVEGGHGCRVNSVARVMREAGIRAKSPRPFQRTTDSDHAHPVAENLLDRRFQASRPNERWVADITCIPTREGWLFLAAVEDSFSRRVVGWAMDATMTSRLVVAVARRVPGEELLVHSDRGSQYASEHDQRVLSGAGIVCRMSRKGNCWDNAPMESVFATLKKELVRHEDYATREQAKASIFESIEAFYNRQRRHSALEYVSPADFEAANPE
jgi:putative transposase